MAPDDLSEAEAKLIQVLEVLVSTQATQGQRDDEVGLLIAVASWAPFLSNPETATLLLQEVLAQSRLLKDGQSLSVLLSTVAESIAKIDQSDLTLSLFKQVLDSADRLENPHDQFAVLRSVTQASRQLSDRNTAGLLLQQVENLSGILYKNGQINLWSEIAQSYGHHAQSQRSQQALETAVQITRSLETSRGKHRLSESQLSGLKRMVRAVRQLDNPSVALRILPELHQVAHGIGDWRDRAEALSLIAQVYGELSDLETARAILQDALKIRPPEEALTTPAFHRAAMSFQVATFTNIAQAYASFADHEAAQAVWQRGLSLVNSPAPEQANGYLVSDRGYQFQKMADAAATVANPEISEAMLLELFAGIQTLGNSHQRSQLLKHIAQAAAQNTDADIAQRLLQETMSLATVAGERDQAYRLQVVAHAAAPHATPDFTRSILSAVMQWAQQPDEEADNDNIVSKIRTVEFAVGLTLECCLEHEVSTAVLRDAIAFVETLDGNGFEAYSLLNVILEATEAKVVADPEALPDILHSLIPAIAQLSSEWPDLVPAVLQIAADSPNLEATTAALHQGFLVSTSSLEGVVRGLFLNQLARAYAQLSEMDKAQDFLQQGLELKDSFQSPFEQVILLNDLALTYQSFANPKKASESLQAGIEITQAIPEAFRRHGLLLYLSETAHQLSESGLASELLLQAIDMAEQFDELRQQQLGLARNALTVATFPPSDANAAILEKFLLRISALPAPHNQHDLAVIGLLKTVICEEKLWSDEVIQACLWSYNY